ncbi:MAG: hypothetical protein ACE5GM_10910 [bacterium]
MLRRGEAIEAAESVKALIESSGTLGTRYTPDPAAENLFGNDDIDYIVGDDFPLERQLLPADTLTKLSADAVINVLPDQELNPEDRVDIDGQLYKVLSVEEQNCFGTVTHKTVRLVKHHGNG